MNPEHCLEETSQGGTTNVGIYTKEDVQTYGKNYSSSSLQNVQDHDYYKFYYHLKQGMSTKEGILGFVIEDYIEHLMYL